MSEKRLANKTVQNTRRKYKNSSNAYKKDILRKEICMNNLYLNLY